jgi:ribosome-associated translation inhibitor RaiA
MQLIVRGHGIAVSSALRDHSTERVERALLPFSHHVTHAELVFTDFNGPRGGIGQACKLSLGLSDGTKLMVQSLDSDFYTASGHAAARAAHLVRRELGRTRTLKRRPQRSTYDSAVAN